MCLRFLSSVFSFCKAIGCYYRKHNFCRLCIWNPPSGLLQIDQKSKKMTMPSYFFDMTSAYKYFDVILFLKSSLVIAPSFMSISSLVLELWQFSFKRDCPEIRKLGIPPSELPNIWRLGRVMNTKFGMIEDRIIKCYWTLQNFKITVFTVFDLLRENQLSVWGGGGGGIPPPPPRLGLNWLLVCYISRFFREIIKNQIEYNYLSFSSLFFLKKISLKQLFEL